MCGNASGALDRDPTGAILMRFITHITRLGCDVALKATWQRHAGPRGCDVALKATWQRHAGPGGAYVYVYIYILHILYSKGIQPSVYRKGIQTL